MSNGEYNKITSTIDSISRDFTYSPDSNNLICIDTSNSRIGINTLDPSYSLHISGGTIYNTSLIVSEISSVSIGVVINDITNKLDSILNLLSPLLPYPVLILSTENYSASTGLGTIIWTNDLRNTLRYAITGYRITIGNQPTFVVTSNVTSTSFSIDSGGGRTTITIVAYNNAGNSTAVAISVTRI